MNIKTMFTDKDDNLELASVLGVIAFIAFIAFSCFAYIYLRQAFSPMEWGTGAGGLAVGHGAGKLLSNKGDYS